MTNRRGGASKRSNSSSKVEIIEPQKDAPNGMPPSVYAEIAAQINQYTDRPDLLLETIERHDPGFIKGMNDETREFAKKSRASRFNFGRAQAYTSLVLSLLVALGILGCVFYTIYNNTASAWVIIALAIFYAITQSGLSGFRKIAHQIAEIVGKQK